MSLHAQTAAYDPDNIFAKILRGELPCEKVYEDAHCLAFMDIMPRSDGHVLVIPKSPARNIIDIDPVSLAAMMGGVQKVARAVQSGMAAEGHMHVERQGFVAGAGQLGRQIRRPDAAVELGRRGVAGVAGHRLVVFEQQL